MDLHDISHEHGPLYEGKTTRAVERVTARAPSMTFLWLAGAATVGSAALFLRGNREAGIFVGLWPIALLAMGNYNKIVKSLDSRGFASRNL